MATEEQKTVSSESLGFKSREKIENPAELLQSSIGGLDKFGGFQLLKGLIKGVENMDPRRKAVKNIFLSDSAYADARKRLANERRHRIQILVIDIVSQVYSFLEMNIHSIDLPT